MSINNTFTGFPMVQQQPQFATQPQFPQVQPQFAQPQLTQSFAQPQLAQSLPTQSGFGGGNILGTMVQMITQMMTMMMTMLQTLVGGLLGGGQQQPQALAQQPQQPVAQQPVLQQPGVQQPILQSQPQQPVLQSQPQQPVVQQPGVQQPVFQSQPQQPVPQGYGYGNQQPCQPQPPVCQPQPPVYTPPQPQNCPPPPPVCHPQPPVYTPPTYGGGNGGYCWGDPHFTDFDQKDGTNSFDFMGQSGKTFNILSDKNVELNTTFQSWGDKGATIMSDAGLQVNGNGSTDQIYFNAQNADKSLSTAAPTINGTAMVANKAVTLADGGTATWDGANGLNVTTAEYNLDLTRTDGGANGSYLKLNANIKDGANPFADGIAPHGVLGQTADGDGKARTGDTGADAQGGGAIQIIDPTTGQVVMSKAGNTQFQDYETNGLWSTTNNAFNRFGENVAQSFTDASGKVIKTVAADGTVLYDASNP